MKADKLVGSRIEGDFKISTFERIPMIKCPKCKHCFKGEPIDIKVIESEYQNGLGAS